MGTKSNPAPFDCYAAAEPDEPMFVLLARDGQGPALVEAWADMREAGGENAAKIAEARQCAAAMRAWRLDHRPDKPAPWDPVLLPGSAADLQSAGYEVRTVTQKFTTLPTPHQRELILRAWTPVPPAGEGWRLHLKGLAPRSMLAIWTRLKALALPAATRG